MPKQKVQSEEEKKQARKDTLKKYSKSKAGKAAKTKYEESEKGKARKQEWSKKRSAERQKKKEEKERIKFKAIYDFCYEQIKQEQRFEEFKKQEAWKKKYLNKQVEQCNGSCEMESFEEDGDSPEVVSIVCHGASHK